jgi:flagellar protein FliL
MAKEPATTEQNQPPPAKGAKSPFLSKKLIMIGVPVFVLQIALLYFVATKFLASPSHSESKKSSETEEKKEEKEGKEGAEPEAQNIYVVKDVIVNPAGTNGTRFVLVTVGFEVSSAPAQKELERKEIQVRDALNTILGTKRLEELANVEHREELRTQISSRVGELLKEGSLNNVYFSKFIIQ